MNSKLSLLVDKLTPEERAELENFAAYLLARRQLRNIQILHDDISTEELTKLVLDSGAFDWLASEEEDVYSIDNGVPVQWSNQ